MRTLFVTRHHGALEWARRQNLDALVVEHLDPSTLSAGDIVIGTVPVHIAAEVCARGARYLHLRLDLPAGFRGRELSADEMEALGATLHEYVVHPPVSADATEAA